MRHLILLTILLTFTSIPQVSSSTEYPQEHWQMDQRGKSDTTLIRLTREMGGDGCIVLNGRILYSWGKVDRRQDWASASKPILSTLLFCALDQGVVHRVDDYLVNYGIPLKGKDTTITFRSLGAMTSGYALHEAAGEAYAYNDYAIQLYKEALFKYIYQKPSQQVTAEQFKMLNFEDPWQYEKTPPHKERISISVRDYARLVWLWRNQGSWDQQQIIRRKLFKSYMKPQVPFHLPHAAHCKSVNDYLNIGSYGGGADHFTHFGPGIYGFNWWFNRRSAQNDGKLLFPLLPNDLIFALGVRGHLAMFSPKRNYALITSSACWGDIGTTSWKPNHELLLRQFINHMDKTYKHELD